MSVSHNIEQFPTRLHEDWRYFRLKPAELKELLDAGKLVDGSAIEPADGVRVLSAGPAEAARALFGHNAFQVDPDLFSQLVADHAAAETISIDKATNRFQAIHLEVNRENGILMRNLQILVQPGVNAEVLLKVDNGATRSLINGEIKILVSEGASLKLNLLTVGSPDALALLRINGLVAENANLHVFNLQTGLGRVRGEYRLTLAGTGGDLKVNQAVIAEGNTINDTVVKMIHAAPETTSDMQTITYATDRGTAILNGLIHVKPGSSNVEAYQQARNYILSDTAYSVGYPQLEIENQEVACSHGTTMHAFDEDQLFYLASRGIDPARGKAMILKGNIDYFFRGMNEENKERFLHLAYGRIDDMNL